MKFISFNCNKKLNFSIFVILSILLIYYKIHNLFYTYNFAELKEHSNATKIYENSTSNETKDKRSSERIKRFLIFQNSGVVKLVLGTSFPIMMADKTRSLNYFYNFQMQYTPPNVPLYWWSFFNTSTFPARASTRKRSTDMLKLYDKSRVLFYKYLEAVFERFGKECLLKAICEVTRAPLSEDFYPSNEEYMTDGDDYGRNIYHQIINTIFTPLDSTVDERYINARVVGQNGANCDETFGECPIVDKLLKRYTQLV